MICMAFGLLPLKVRYLWMVIEKASESMGLASLFATTFGFILTFSFSFFFTFAFALAFSCFGSLSSGKQCDIVFMCTVAGG